MKIILSLMLLININLSAQKHVEAIYRPVTWTFSPLMVQPGIYTVHAQVDIEKGWMIFSGHQKPSQQYRATTFTFEQNPLIKILKIEEGGVVYQDSCYKGYTGYADFEIKVVVRNRGSAILKGRVSYEPYRESNKYNWISEEPFEVKLN